MEGVLVEKKDTSVIDDYANQLYEVSEIILFSLGKELMIDEEYLKMMVSIGKMNFESNLYENLDSIDIKTAEFRKQVIDQLVKNKKKLGSVDASKIMKDVSSKL